MNALILPSDCSDWTGIFINSDDATFLSQMLSHKLILSFVARFAILTAIGIVAFYLSSRQKRDAQEYFITSFPTSPAIDANSAYKPSPKRSTLVVFYSEVDENEQDLMNDAVKTISEYADADIARIVPQESSPDENGRPLYQINVDNWDDYDVVFFGFPVCDGNLPKVCCAFLQDQEWIGKTIVPFLIYQEDEKSIPRFDKLIKKQCYGALVLNQLNLWEEDLVNQPQKSRIKTTEWLKSLVY